MNWDVIGWIRSLKKDKDPPDKPKIEKDLNLEHHTNILKNTGDNPSIEIMKKQILDSVEKLNSLGFKYNRPSKESVVMRSAFLQSELSTCLKLRVGAVLTDQRFRTISSGYNGTPVGFPHCCDEQNIENHTAKYDIHAEENCLNSCRWSPVGSEESFIFVTYFPCIPCCKAILASKDRLNITKLYYVNEFSDDEDKYGCSDEGKDLLEKMNITVIQLK
jgi:dCMP deaminase